MGTNFKELVARKEISEKDLNDKKLVVDSFNILYQFLSSIRQRDGTPLMDSRGNITSHLTGLFSRTTKLMQSGIKLAFVFDGKPPLLKQKERERRKNLKIEAKKQYMIAEERQDITEMKKYASRTSVLSTEMIEESKKLITALGLPVIQAPSEGEAQAAHIVKKEDAYASVSQDYDSLLYCVPRVIHNLTISGKKKQKDRLSYQTIRPEMISLSETLNKLGIDREQLIAVAMLIGTDYNIGGIKGIGPKHAIKMVKEHKDFDALFKAAGWDDSFDFAWNEVFDLFRTMPVTDDYDLEWKPADPDRLIELLVEKHDFSRERVENTLSKFEKNKQDKQQKGLGDFF